MLYEDMRIAYEKDLKKYGYVKQSTINSFALKQEKQEPIKKSKIGTTYLQKIQNDLTEYWSITNDTVNRIIWFTPQKLKKTIRKKKKVVKIKNKQPKRKYIKDSHIYHKIFDDYYWDIKHCMICWSTERLQIHHKDKNHKNNDISNLIKVCFKCHCLAHKWDRVYKLMIRQG